MEIKVGQKVYFYDNDFYKGIGVVLKNEGNYSVIELPRNLQGWGWHDWWTPTDEDNYWHIRSENVLYIIAGNKRYFI